MPHRMPIAMVNRHFAGRVSPTSRHLSPRKRSETHADRNNHGTLLKKMWCRKSATNKDAMMANSNATSHTLSRRPSRGRSIVFTQPSLCKRPVISREYNSAFMAREFRYSSLTILAWVALSIARGCAASGSSRLRRCLRNQRFPHYHSQARRSAGHCIHAAGRIRFRDFAGPPVCRGD